MKFTYLGTAAAEGIPAMFCACDTCKRALSKGGKNYMTRSQALVNDNLLIDFGGDTYTHFLSQNKTLSDVEYLIITHSHFDHLDFNEFFCRYETMAYNTKVEKLKVYMSAVAYNIMQKASETLKIDFSARDKRFEFIIVEPFKTIDVGEYKITPLPAVHASENEALLYLIEKDGKSIFYGNDTGIFSEDIDNFLLENKKRIDLLSLDCTKCDVEYNYFTHMSMSEGKKIAERFEKKNILKPNTKKFYTHFSHNGGMIYDEMEKVAKEKYDFSVAYDGLCIEL